MSAQSFSRDRLRRVVAGGDLAPNNIDVTAQIVDLVRKGERDADVADGMFDALDFSA